MKFHATSILLIILLSPLLALGQDQDTTTKTLPFGISEVKKIPESELEDKKEGSFLTGLPRFEFDPIRGFGAGGNLNFFINNTAEDPFFSYTPYRHKVNLEFFIYQNGRVRYAVNYDAPYIFNTKWRVRMDLVHWEDPHAQYWGIGRSSLDNLSFRDKRTGQTRTFRKINHYEDNLALAEQKDDGGYYTDFHRHHMFQREQLYNLLAERTFLVGRLRFMFGLEGLFTSFQSFEGDIAEEAYALSGEEVEAVNHPTLVDEQMADGTWDRFNLHGFTNSRDHMFTGMLAAALMYDTRDFEPDPSKGVLLQYSHEHSGPWLLSDFNFNKFMIQGQIFKTLKRWRNDKSRLTFAGSASFGHIFGPKINFIEMWDLSSQAEAGGIMVLGGARSLRGYREARFLAPTVGLINLELRSRLYDFRMLNQHFAIGLTPFMDIGSVWNRPGDVNLKKWKNSAGLGGRLAWNQSTILRLDFAKSQEGNQVFFGFDHIF